MRRFQWTLTKRRAMLGIAFISPWLLGFLFLFFIPLIQSVSFSFHKLTMIEGGYELTAVGWQNFKDALLVNPTFNRILTESVIDMIINVPLILFFSLFTATLLNQKFRGRTAARAIFFLPVILASSAITAAEASGLINLIGDANAINEMGSAASSFNGDYIIMMLLDLGIPSVFVEYLMEAILRIYDIVSSSGVQIIIFLAALQSIPGSMYEVAKIEGATSYETFWKITFPMVSPLILTNVIYTIIDSFSNSTITRTIYTTAFQSLNFGLSAAMAWLYTLVIAIILIVIGVSVSRRVFYYD
ncbi:L-arabinose transport system permease protein AraP [compost metagenome]